MEVELQILCFRSPRPCASSPDLHVHLDLALLVLLLLVVLGVLEVFLVFGGEVAEKVVLWWLWMGWSEVDGWEWNGMDMMGWCGGFYGPFPTVVEV